jgi:hypothetical protein
VPALLTRISIRPNLSSVFSINCSQSSSLATLVLMKCMECGWVVFATRSPPTGLYRMSTFNYLEVKRFPEHFSLEQDSEQSSEESIDWPCVGPACMQQMRRQTDRHLLHVCNNDFCSFFCETLADCFSEARASACDNCYFALKACAENFWFAAHVVGLPGYQSLVIGLFCFLRWSP